MRNIITKGFITVGTVLVALLASKAAMAKDCKEPMAFASGIQDFAKPDNSSPVVRNGEQLRVRMYCNAGKAGGVTTSSGLSKGTVVPADIQKKGNIEILLRSEYVEFTGTVSGSVGEPKDYTFTDGGGATYTVSIIVGDKVATQGAIDNLEQKKADKKDLEGKANKSDLEGKANKSDVDETNKRVDDALSRLGGEGNMVLDASPIMYYRPSYSVAVGGEARGGWRFGRHDELAFKLTFIGGGAHGYIPTRPVSGVPYTGQTLDLNIMFFGVGASADIPVGERVSFELGGSILPTWYSYPQGNVGQEPGSTVWDVPPSSQFSVLFQADLLFRVYATSSNHTGLFFQLFGQPGVETPTKKSAGGTDNDAKFRLMAGGGVGVAFL